MKWSDLRDGLTLYAIGIVVGWTIGVSMAIVVLRTIRPDIRDKLIENMVAIVIPGYQVPLEYGALLTLVGGTAIALMFMKWRYEVSETYGF